MPTHWKKIALTVLPLAGLLFTAPAVFAHEHHHRHDWSECNHSWHDRGRHEGRRYHNGDRYEYSRPAAPWYGSRRYSEGDHHKYSQYSAPWFGQGWRNQD